MQYVPILMVLAISIGVACLLAFLPAVLGPRRPSPVKLESFECGKDPIALSEGRFAIKFSTTAIFFNNAGVELDRTDIEWQGRTLNRRIRSTLPMSDSSRGTGRAPCS